MKYNLYIICIALLVCNSMVLRAQVTIGSGNSPAKGLLLQIKDTEPTDPDTNNETVAKGGLILPRVNLVKANTLEPFITNATSDEMKAHEGLMVYNTNICLNHKGNDNGVYGWYGTSWLKMGEEEEDIPEIEYVEDIEGNKYRARKFGDAGVWMIENLAVRKYADGTLLPTFPSTVGDLNNLEWCYPAPNPAPNPLPNGASGLINGTDPFYFQKQSALGLLYNYYTATRFHEYGADINESHGSTNELAIGVQGICPDGWHVPSDKEWNKLEEEIAIRPHLYSNNTGTVWKTEWSFGNPGLRPATSPGHGESMKATCVPVFGAVSNMLDAKSFITQKGGFSAILAGFGGGISSSGKVNNYGRWAQFWTSSSFSINNGKGRFIALGQPGVQLVESSNKGNLFSIRCKKN